MRKWLRYGAERTSRGATRERLGDGEREERRFNEGSRWSVASFFFPSSETRALPSEFRLQPSRSSPRSRLCSLAPSPPPFLLLLNTPPPKHRLYSSSPQSRKGPIRRRNNSFPLNKREREPFFLSSIPFESRRPSPPFSRIGFALSPTPTAASMPLQNPATAPSIPKPKLKRPCRCCSAKQRPSG